MKRPGGITTCSNWL